MINPAGGESGGSTLSVLTIASAYPSSRLPHHNPFIHLRTSAIRDLGNDVRVIAPRRFPRLLFSPTDDEWGGIRVHRPRYFSPGVARPWENGRLRLSHRSFIRAVRRSAGRLPPPDAVLGYFLRPAGAAAAELGELWRRPAVVVIGEGDIVGHNRVASDEENGAVARRLAGLVTLNEGARSEVIERYRLDPWRVAVIPVGVDTSVFSPGDRMAARRRLDLAPEGFVVVYVGRLEHNKGSDRVAQAVNGLDGVTAIFVGPGKLGSVQPNCLSVGPVPHDKVPEYLKAADAFVLPSLIEGVSNAVVEAMACGLPVIISERQFSRSAADDQAGIFVDPLAPEEIRRAIAALRDDPARRARMGSAAREQASRSPSAQQAAIFVRWLDEMRRVKRDPDANGR